MTPVEAYRAQGLERVAGWLDPYSAEIIAGLAEHLPAAGVAGAFGEIGIHHGKLFILLKLASGQADGVAIDVFGRQDLNIDGSGLGDRAVFEANVARWAPGGGRVVVIERSSLDVAPADILGAVGPCRIFSVDGGHTEDCTRSDLRLAEAVLAEGGVVILDDYFNEDWPDVSTGAALHFVDPTTRLRPFAICPNKLLLADPRHHAALQAALVSRRPSAPMRRNRMFGHEVVILQPPPRLAAPDHREMDRILRLMRAFPGRMAWHAFSRSPVGRGLIRLRDTVRGTSRG